MNTGFFNPLSDKNESKKMKSPWNFDCPHYDERSSCHINAGSHHGVGHRQPIGHHGEPKQMVEALPQHVKKGMEVSKVPHRNLPIDMEL